MTHTYSTGTGPRRRPTRLRTRWESDPVRRDPEPSTQDIEAVGAVAEMEVERLCFNVRLNMAKRLIELLQTIKFHGSKHPEGVDVFVETEIAESICKQVALALQVCNLFLWIFSYVRQLNT